MSLMQLLAVGRSIRTIKDRPSPYKMTQQNLLPKFGGTRDEGQELAAANSPVPHPSHREARDPSEHGPAEEPPGAAATSARDQSMATMAQPYPAGRWSFIKHHFGRRPAAVPTKAPVQGELRLDAVRVIRNDLADTDLEIRPLSPPTKGEEMEKERRGSESHGFLWTRITTRLFGAGRT